MPAILEHATFAGRLNETFTAVLEGGEEVALELIEIESLNPGGADDPARRSARRNPFSMVFSGPKEKPLNQGTFRIEHDALGSFNLFLVPIGEDGSARCYEAVFN